jgi:hypothetical protein
MLENYKTMYVQAINENNPAYRAPFNQVSHMRQLLTHEFTAVVGPNNDTLYSLAWLDLGTEPQVLSLPDIPDDRYYVFQICDMYTFNIEYIGARTTGHKPRNISSRVLAGTVPHRKGSMACAARKAGSCFCWDARLCQAWKMCPRSMPCKTNIV